MGPKVSFDLFGILSRIDDSRGCLILRCFFHFFRCDWGICGRFRIGFGFRFGWNFFVHNLFFVDNLWLFLLQQFFQLLPQFLYLRASIILTSHDINSTNHVLHLFYNTLFLQTQNLLPVSVCRSLPLASKML